MDMDKEETREPRIKMEDSKIMEIIKESMKDAGFKLNEAEQTKIFGIIRNMISEDASLKDTMGLNQQFLESLYGLAYQLYNSGKYRDSGAVFRVLSVTDPKDTRFTMGLAASEQMNKDYDEAINSYLLCGQQDPFNPMPFFYLYECYRQTNRMHEAFYALCETLNRIQHNPIYLPLLSKTMLMLEGLQKDIEDENYAILKEKHLLKADFDKNDDSQVIPSVENDVQIVEHPETPKEGVKAGQ